MPRWLAAAPEIIHVEVPGDTLGCRERRRLTGRFRSPSARAGRAQGEGPRPKEEISVRRPHSKWS